MSDRDEATERFRLSLLSVDTREKSGLTEPEAGTLGDRDPAVSRDGRMLAFIRETTYVGEVYVLPLSRNHAPDGKSKRLTFDNLTAYGAAWTADGRDVIFASTDVQAGLWRMAASGAGRPRPFEYAGVDAAWPTVSLDGHRLAYAQFEKDDNIWRIERSGAGGAWRPAERFHAISSTRGDSDAVFSPDSRKIAFVSDRSGSPGIWVCDRDGSIPLQLTSLGHRSDGPRWSPSGGKIAFNSDAAGNWDVYVISADGGSPRRLTTSEPNEAGASWSRDGSWIYFTSNRGGGHQIWKMPAAGGAAVQVTRNGGYAASEAVDGGTLYYTKYSTTSPLYSLPLNGGEEKQVLESVHAHSFLVTKEGIYYLAALQPGRGAPVRFFDFASGDSRLVARTEMPECLHLSVSPDRDTILYTQCDHLGSDLMLVENFR